MLRAGVVCIVYSSKSADSRRQKKPKLRPSMAMLLSLAVARQPGQTRILLCETLIMSRSQWATMTLLA